MALSENRISGSVPAALGNLTSLIELDVFCNKLSGSLPREFLNLTGLVDLNMGATTPSPGSCPPTFAEGGALNSSCSR